MYGKALQHPGERAGEAAERGVDAGLLDAFALVALAPLIPALLWALSIAAAVLG